MLMNEFTLMNSVLEFRPVVAGVTNTSSTSSASNQNVYVMGDFALLEVLQIVKQAGWTVTGVHNQMILESPKTSFMH
jgi:hypothetical protein